MNDQAALLDDIMTRAATSLADALATYWPTLGNTGLHERNLSMHVAAALVNAEFAVFGEAHADGGASSRYDLVACSRQRDLFIVAEFKQLWTPSRMRDMWHDLARLQEFQPVPRNPAVTPQPNMLGLIAALTEYDIPYIQRLEEQATVVPGAPASRVEAARSEWRSKRICEHGRHPDRPGEFYVTYAIQVLGNSSW
jgi:hypothetical protein